MPGWVVHIRFAVEVVHAEVEGEEGMGRAVTKKKEGYCADCHRVEFKVLRAKADLAVAARRAANHDSPYWLRQVTARQDDLSLMRAWMDDHMSVHR